MPIGWWPRWDGLRGKADREKERVGVGEKGEENEGAAVTEASSPHK